VRSDRGLVGHAHLRTTFDLVISVGNTLSYLHADAELAAAFNTIRTHSHPGILLALATLTGSGRDTHSGSESRPPRRGHRCDNLDMGPCDADSNNRPNVALHHRPDRTTHHAPPILEPRHPHRHRARRGIPTLSSPPSDLTLCAQRRQ
jgi:hypothetical protein